MGDPKRKFTFVSKALPQDTFDVVSFKGFEGISKPYEFEITLVSDDPEIDFKSVLENPATLTILRDQGDLPIHGMVAQFEQLEETAQQILYQALLVPRFWQLSLHHHNQLFLDKSVPEVIEESLKQANLTSQDYTLKLTRSYPKWEYISQYRETHLNFISRWMEREGIYYFFEQTEDIEKLIITDTSTSHKDVPGGKPAPYRPLSGMVPEEEFVKALIYKQKVLPKKVILKDYNYRKPSLELKGESIVDQKGRGEVYLYGEHFKDPEEGNGLAKIRAEEIRCREKIFYGESTLSIFESGFFFELQDHYRNSFNQKYLLTELEHEGKQAGLVLVGIENEKGGKEKESVYTNRFVAIPAHVQFRPERKTEKPKINGTMNARVDAAGSGQYAEIDKEGRYKVILPYDLSGNKGGKASRWIRMSQPYSGADYGMHFPLHKGTEVLLTFVDGDPDRPIIAGTVPNPENTSPVKDSNQTQCVIKTGGDNKIIMEDSQGKERILVSSPRDKTYIRLGTEGGDGTKQGQAGTAGIETQTDADEYIYIGGKRFKKVTGEQESQYLSNTKTLTMGTTTETFIGHKDSTHIGGAKELFIGVKDSICIALCNELFVGLKNSTAVAGSNETFVGLKNSICVGGSNEVFVGLKNSIAVAGSNEIFVGLKNSIAVAGSNEIFVGLKNSICVGGSNEVFVGVKLSNAIAAAIEGFLGLKLTMCAGINIELDASLKIKNQPIVLSPSTSAALKKFGAKLENIGFSLETDNFKLIT